MGLAIMFLSGACIPCGRVRIAPPAPVQNITLAPPIAWGPVLRLPLENAPLFDDDADTGSLRTAILASLDFYRKLPADKLFALGSDTYTARDLGDSLTLFLTLLEQAKSPSDWQSAVRNEFVAYQSTGTDVRQTVTFSAYYEPAIAARLRKTETYRYPIYGRPPDLIDVDLGSFDPSLQGRRITGRPMGKNLVPYYTRGDIDSRKVLGKNRRAIAWAKDPLDIFFLQVEGTGWLDLGHGKKARIRYDGDNGRPYTSIGRYLIDSGRVSGGLTHGEFRRYMRQHPEERQALLNVDERYVFFRIDTSTASDLAYGNIEEPLTPGRSIATDPRLFPKGILAWITVDADSKHRVQRFVLNQDEGGAIKGPGRVDFFAGHGPAAERFAANFWRTGQLYFLVKKKT